LIRPFFYSGRAIRSAAADSSYPSRRKREKRKEKREKRKEKREKRKEKRV